MSTQPDNESFALTIITKALPSPQECRDYVEKIKREKPNATQDRWADAAIAAARNEAAFIGAISGAVSMPLVGAPLAVTELARVIILQSRVAGTLSMIYDDPKNPMTKDEFDGQILTILFPTAVSQVISQLGVRAGQGAAKALIKKYISGEVLRAIVRWAAKYLGLKLSQRILLKTFLPIVGGVVGGTWNWFEMKTLGNRAKKFCKGEITLEEMAGEAKKEDDAAGSKK